MLRYLLLLSVTALFLLTGCEPPTGVVKGKVTFEGQPLEAGQVRFEPAANIGQTAGAEVTKGEFVAKGLVPTKYKVRVDGEFRPPKITAPNGPESKRRMTDAEILAQSDPLPADTEGRDQELEVIAGEQTLEFKLTSPSAKK